MSYPQSPAEHAVEQANELYELYEQNRMEFNAGRHGDLTRSAHMDFVMVLRAEHAKALRNTITR